RHSHAWSRWFFGANQGSHGDRAASRDVASKSGSGCGDGGGGAEDRPKLVVEGLSRRYRCPGPTDLGRYLSGESAADPIALHPHHVSPLRSLKFLIWLYFALLLLEGVLRKWVLPGLSNP